MDVTPPIVDLSHHDEGPVAARKDKTRVAAPHLPSTEILPSNGLAALYDPVPVPLPKSSASAPRRTSRASRKRMRTEEAIEQQASKSSSTSSAADLAALGVTPRATEDELEALNNDFCDTCHGHGRFICCDGCPRSFHFACVCPPLDVDEMPFPNGTLLPHADHAQPHDMRAQRALADDSWFCQVCFSERMLPTRAPEGYGPFGVLLQHLDTQNPRIFALPDDIRTYYKGVGTGPDGVYMDTIAQRPVKLSRQGFAEDRDPYQLRDKHGAAVLCFRCGQSALPDGPSAAQGGASHGRRMLSCDFCTLHWHLDCVDPPLTGMPPATRRWRCPAHSTPGRPRMRIPRAPQHTRTIQVAPGAPLPATGDAYVHIVPDPHDKFFDPETGAGRAKPYEDVTLDTDHIRTRYRIPEKTIRLAFWTAITRQWRRQQPPTPSAPAPTSSPRVSYPPLDALVDVAVSQNEPLEFVPTPTGEVHAEYATATRASLQPDALPYVPSQRSSYEGNERPSGQVPSTYLYPREIRELRDLKRTVEMLGGFERVRGLLGKMAPHE